MTTLYYLAVSLGGTSDPTLHMTLCIIASATAAKRGDELMSDLELLAAGALPLSITYGERGMFGDEKNIPVRLVAIDDPSKKALLDTFALKYGETRPGHEAEGPTQRFHVTIKNLPDEEAAGLKQGVATRMLLGIVGEKGKTIWEHGV
jgi:hypothetical protein